MAELDARAVLDALPIPVSVASVVRDDGGRIVDFVTEYVNDASIAYSGIPREQQVGRRATELLPGFAETELFADLVAAIERGEPHRWEALPFRADIEGRVIEGVYESDIVPLGDRYVSTSRDITARVQAEEELRASEARLAEAQRIAQLGSWEWEVASGEVLWSEQLYRIFGVDRASFTPTFEAYLERVHPDDREQAQAVVWRCVETREPFSIIERIRRPDGAWRTIHAGGQLVADHATQRVVGVVHDITELSRAQEELARARADLERRRAANAQAAQINERIVASLVEATQAMDAGDERGTRRAIQATLEHASGIVTELQRQRV